MRVSATKHTSAHTSIVTRIGISENNFILRYCATERKLSQTTPNNGLKRYTTHYETHVEICFEKLAIFHSQLAIFGISYSDIIARIGKSENYFILRYCASERLDGR